jgi:hypothetical protein
MKRRTVFADERDWFYTNAMRTLTKWYRKNIFWLNDIRYISILIFGHPLILMMASCILLHMEAMGSNAKARAPLRVLSDIFSWALILLRESWCKK